MCLQPLIARKFFSVSRRLAAVQRSTCAPSPQRLTFRLRSLTPLLADSMMFVERTDLLSCSGRPSRWTVSVSSNPSSKLLAALGLILWSSPASERSCLRAFPSSLSLYACVIRRETHGRSLFERCSRTFRFLWTVHRWTGVFSPRTSVIARRRAFAPSITTSIG